MHKPPCGAACATSSVAPATFPRLVPYLTPGLPLFFSMNRHQHLPLMVYPVFKSVADQRHPITTKLTELFGGKLFERAKTRVKKAEGEGGPSPRVEIVSEKLIGKGQRLTWNGVRS